MEKIISNLADSDLLQRIQADDDSAFNYIHEQYWKLLFDRAYRVTEDKEAAADIVQEVFISFWTHAKKGDVNQIKYYLLQSVKYQTFKLIRSKYTQRRYLDQLERVISRASTDEHIAAQELQQIIDAYVEALPEKCREVFKLSRYHHLSQQQIATQLNIATKTVENHINRALNGLRISLEQLPLIFAFLFF